MKILLVDDHPSTRVALSVLLRPLARRIDEAGTPAQALELARTGNHDLAILDLRLHDGITGISVCRELKSMADPPRVLCYTAYGCPQQIAAALAAGADSYVHKATECGELVDAVERTCRGERVWLIGSGGPPPTADSLAAHAGLGIPMTKREQEVLALLLRRYSNAEIAERLVLAPQTVKNHVSKVLRKLGVGGRRELFRAVDPGRPE